MNHSEKEIIEVLRNLQSDNDRILIMTNEKDHFLLEAYPNAVCVNEKKLPAVHLEDFDVFIDALGIEKRIPNNLRPLFQALNESDKTVYCIGVNSGADPEGFRYDIDALCSDITFVKDEKKPFHEFRKYHDLFAQCVCFGTVNENLSEMSEERFLSAFPEKNDTDYKGSHGKVLTIGGSFGMAGACTLNILGAKTAGASYLLCALPQEIYSIVAPSSISTVYLPLANENWYDRIHSALNEVSAVSFGSGCVFMNYKKDLLDVLLQECRVPLVLDAEALQLLRNDRYLLDFAKAPVILTPHIGEFSALTGLRKLEIEDQLLETTKQFAKENHVTLVLKGPHTVVTSPDGRQYINQTGNPALAQAGSGDVLTGIITGLCAYTDAYTAACMGTYLHGLLADIALTDYSMHTFPLESYPSLMNDWLKSMGR